MYYVRVILYGIYIYIYRSIAKRINLIQVHNTGLTSLKNIIAILILILQFSYSFFGHFIKFSCESCFRTAYQKIK